MTDAIYFNLPPTCDKTQRKGPVWEDLPCGKTVLSEDQYRAIQEIHLANGIRYSTGAGCRRIVAYDEKGQHAYIPMLAVIDYHEEIVIRVPAYRVTVHYGDMGGIPNPNSIRHSPMVRDWMDV